MESERAGARAQRPGADQFSRSGGCLIRLSGGNLSTVSEDERDQERGDRDRDRSEEAHWRVAEEGAEDKDDPKQKTEKSQEDTRTTDR
jgi:hypothetical protein